MTHPVKWIHFLLFAMTLQLLNGCMQVTTSDISTSYGTLRGTTNGVVNTYYGVPFASPPVGDLRWRPPQPPKRWSNTKMAVLPKPACIQTSTPNAAMGQSEDCLYLNIWAPTTPGPHPVMFWIHGGGFVLGSGGDVVYIGSELAAQKDVVVVTISYRLSYLGFFSHPELSAESEYGASGNQGFLDQVAALKWVNQEIERFGGDPNNVTIFGQSAGGVSVCKNLASPLTEGLFQRAIIQSGPCGVWETVSLSDAEQTGNAFAAKMGCTDANNQLECLKAIDAKVLRDNLEIPPNEIFAVSIDNWKFKPVATIDNHFIPNEPFELIDNGSRSHIPILSGVVKDEGSFFEYMKDQPSGASSYTFELQKRYGLFANTVEKTYPYYRYGTASEAISEITSDEFILCPNLFFSERLSNAGHEVYYYHFTQDVYSMLNVMFIPLKGINAPAMGTFHVAEIPYILGLSNPTGNVDTPSRRLTSSHMMNYWSNFAKAGNPNGSHLPNWPAFSDDNSSYLELGNSYQVHQGLRSDTCPIWFNRGV